MIERECCECLCRVLLWERTGSIKGFSWRSIISVVFGCSVCCSISKFQLWRGINLGLKHTELLHLEVCVPHIGYQLLGLGILQDVVKEKLMYRL